MTFIYELDVYLLKMHLLTKKLTFWVKGFKSDRIINTQTDATRVIRVILP